MQMHVSACRPSEGLISLHRNGTPIRPTIRIAPGGTEEQHVAAFHSVEDFRKAARARLPRMVYDYVDGGAEGERGLTRNETGFERWRFLPRRLVDVSARSLETTLWDRRYPMPVYLAPTGLNGIVRPGGDAMLARAAAKAGVPFALSTASNMSLEEVAREGGDGEKWFQLYVLNRELAEILVRRAREARYDALILTVDAHVNGYRERDMRNGFGLPARYTPRTLLDGALHPRWSMDFLRHGVPKLSNFETMEASSPETQAALLSRKMDASFDWEALAWLRDLWPGRLMVKGLLRSDDALRCAELGVDAVILSNHGGRQLDGNATAVDCISGVVRHTEMPVFFDGGIRRGTDVLKGLCLGASMVGLGRATLYAMAAEGEAGVTRCFEILRDEMDRAMALLGTPSVDALAPDLLTEA